MFLLSVCPCVCLPTSDVISAISVVWIDGLTPDLLLVHFGTKLN